jgi:ABC-2 type transport system ATP-binding protein
MVLKISNLNKTYQNDFKALNDVNIEIRQGEKIALLGLNGAGKSSLVGIMAGSIIKTSGEVIINGFNIETERIKATKSIGVVHQELIYDTFFTVRETLKIHSGYYGFKNNENEIDELMHAIDLYDKADTNTRYLSGGMKRRLMVAKALITNPKIIILDEPTVGVDVSQKDKMYSYIDRINKEKNITIMLTTHYMDEAELLCDKIIVIHKGQIIAQGSKDEIINKYKIKELVFNLDYLDQEDKIKNLIASIFEVNKIEKYHFVFSNLTVYYHESDGIEMNRIYELIKSSGAKIKNLKSLDCNLELAFKKIIEESNCVS